MKQWIGGQQVDVPGSTNFDWTDGTTLYIGVAAPRVPTSANAWRVTRITFDGQNRPTSIKVANNGQPIVYDDRATAEYA